MILGAFWIAYHVQFHAIRSINRMFIWINLVTLMFVALLPFSTTFPGDFSDIPLGGRPIVFQANLLLIGVGLLCQWEYATHGHHITDPDLPQARIRRGRMRSLVIPVVSLLCILPALTGNTSSSAGYLFTPLFAWVAERIARDRND